MHLQLFKLCDITVIVEEILIQLKLSQFCIIQTKKKQQNLVPRVQFLTSQAPPYTVDRLYYPVI